MSDRRLCLPLFAMLSGALVGACAPGGTGVEFEELIGDWYGERVEGGMPLLWVSRFTAENEFSVRFYYCQNGEVVSYSHHEGTGSLDPFGRILTRTFAIDGSEELWEAPSEEEWIENKYRIARFSGDDMEYVHVDFGDRYRTRRVDADFEPRCPRNRAAAARRQSGQNSAWVSLIRSEQDTDVDAVIETVTGTGAESEDDAETDTEAGDR